MAALRGHNLGRRSGRERGLILLTVLVVITISALAGTSALYIADAELESVDASLGRVQSRALAWSGVQAAMAELLEQRDHLLDGGEPELTREWTLFSEGSGRAGTVRLVAWSDDRVAASEGGKLDINAASAEMLAAIGAMDESVARRIVEARRKRRFASIDELVGVEGITREMLDGEAASGVDGEATAGLRSVLTTLSFDPNIQAGIGDDAAAHRGKRRVNLNTPWSDGLKRSIADRFGDGIASGIESLMKRGDTFDDMADVVKTMRTVGLPPEEWGAALDAFTVSEDPYLAGRVDLSSAPAEVLACVPGIDEAAAEEIVLARSRLDAASRSNPAWPVVQGILTGEQFERAVDWVTTRSMQWRVRVEAGMARAEETSEGASFGPGEFGLEQAGVGSLEERIVLEAVIDVASQRPRVAYLRDVTFLRAAAVLSALAPPEEELALAAPPDEPASEPDASAEDGFDNSLVDMDFGEGFGGTDGPGLGSVRGAGTDGDEGGAPFGGAFGDQDEDPADMPEGETPAGEGSDRRLGRWTTGGGAR